MPSQKVSWAEIKNHLHYSKWIYLIIVLVVWFGFDLVYQMTAYRVPAERRVDIQLVTGGFMDVEMLEPLAARMLEDAQAHDQTLEAVNFIQLQYSGDPDTDYAGAQKFSVMIGAREGDIWVLPRQNFEMLHAQGAFIPLDPYIESGILNVADIDLAPYTLPAPSEARDADGLPVPPDGPPGVYALPAPAALTQAGYPVPDACMAIMAYSVNPDTSAAALDSMLQRLAGGVLPVEEDSMGADPE